METSEQLPVRCLTLRQPWAWAIIWAGKDTENRSWKPSRPFRMLVHAGLTYDPEGEEQLSQMGIKVPPDARYGGNIIGAIDVTGWRRDSTSRWADPGHWNWQLANPVPAKPPILGVTGRAGFFRPPPDWQTSFPPSRRSGQ